jgi:hypothetical protein
MRSFLVVCTLIGFLVSRAATSGEWQVVGPGNATCKNWVNAGVAQRNEILGWLTGFASAINLELASEGKKEMRMDLMTYEYLGRELDGRCASTSEASQSMIGLLMLLLKDFPLEK